MSNSYSNHQLIMPKKKKSWVRSILFKSLAAYYNKNIWQKEQQEDGYLLSHAAYFSASLTRSNSGEGWSDKRECPT